MIPPNPEFIGVGCRGKWRSFSAVLTVNPKKTRIQGNSVTRPLAVSLPRPLTKRVKGLEDQMSKIKLKNIFEIEKNKRIATMMCQKDHIFLVLSAVFTCVSSFYFLA